MSSKEMEMWLSRESINVSAEEDVFKIILIKRGCEAISG